MAVSRRAESDPVRLIPFAYHGAAENMAIDAALLGAAQGAVLRFYGWEPPAISLGRFQKDGAALDGLRASGLAIVRRITGGGAIVHWHEVTYSLVLPSDHPSIAQGSTRESYRVLHGPIVCALRAMGVPAEQRLAADTEVSAERRSALCFHRVTDLDVVAGGRKLLGSAQRRTRGRVLQHGSLVLRPNALQPGTAALSDFLEEMPAPEAVSDALALAYEALLGPLRTGALNAEERDLAEKLLEEA